MSAPVTIILNEEPVGKGRPRFHRRSGHAYTPDKTRAFEKRLAEAAAQEYFAPPLTGPLSVKLLAQLPIPKSWSRKKQDAALRGEIAPGKPDIDNLIKTLDALNGIVWADDAQITHIYARKVYGDPMLVVTVEAACHG